MYRFARRKRTVEIPVIVAEYRRQRDADAQASLSLPPTQPVP